MEYYNSKFSNTSISKENIIPSSTFLVPEDNDHYATMNLSPDPHFDNVLVNNSHSSVHIPTNIFDRCKKNWNQPIMQFLYSQRDPMSKFSFRDLRNRTYFMVRKFRRSIFKKLRTGFFTYVAIFCQCQRIFKTLSR